MIAMKIVSTQMKCQMKVNLPGIEFLGTEPKLRLRKKIHFDVFTSSIKRPVRGYLEVVVQ